MCILYGNSWSVYELVGSRNVESERGEVFLKISDSRLVGDAGATAHAAINDAGVSQGPPTWSVAAR